MSITIQELKKEHIAKNPHSVFFDTATLRSFGESLSQMSVLQEKVKVKDRYDFTHYCYVVSSRRWRTQTVHYYFDEESLKLINPKRW